MRRREPLRPWTHRAIRPSFELQLALPHIFSATRGWRRACCPCVRHLIYGVGANEWARSSDGEEDRRLVPGTTLRRLPDLTAPRTSVSSFRVTRLHTIHRGPRGGAPHQCGVRSRPHQMLDGATRCAVAGVGCNALLPVASAIATLTAHPARRSGRSSQRYPWAFVVPEDTEHVVHKAMACFIIQW